LLLAKKLSIQMVAEALRRSDRTIEGHVGRLKQKFHLQTFAQLQNFSALLCQRAYLRLAEHSSAH
jgi:DNA-binding NarL/FixJ family response regulator